MTSPDPTPRSTNGSEDAAISAKEKLRPETSARARFARLTRVFPSTAAGNQLVLVALVDSFGTGIFLSGSVVFLTQVAGLTAAQIGLGLSAAGIVGLISTVPIGLVADRVGTRKVLVALQVWRAAWFVAYAFTASFPFFFIVACMLAMAEKATGPLNQAVVGAAVGDNDRVRTMALVRVVRNVGFSLGALAGTTLVALGSHAGFRGIVLTNAASFLLAGVLLARIPLLNSTASARRNGPWHSLASLRDGRYLALTALNAIVVMHMTLLAVGIPLWIVMHTSAPPALAGLIILVNTVLVVLLQVRASSGCDDITVASGRMRWAAGALAGCCLLLELSSGTTPVVATSLILVAVVLLTGAEMWQAAGSWGISYELAPSDRRSEYLSVFSLGTTLQSIIGPVLLTALVVPHTTVGWLGLGLLFVVTGLVLPAVAAPRRQPA
ncbi:MFS transporter [Nonomuraea sp. K274]|uniref:MFS transporter n=1 Tax=Nonomuraea cypriaca TaxID=1187855 RepID=A0A931ALA2_9ACTN|nr:MFS transporter [Nonomuraea cypriaca]MBF8194053.1 MFS transporter [Nonomuraea cypriaca]